MVIAPTVGRVLWYWPHGHKEKEDAQPCAAIVTYVHGDRLVNLAWFDPNGERRAATSVTLAQEGDPAPASPGYPFAEWPAQAGRAQKAEEPQKQLEA